MLMKIQKYKISDSHLKVVHLKVQNFAVLSWFFKFNSQQEKKFLLKLCFLEWLGLWMYSRPWCVCYYLLNTFSKCLWLNHREALSTIPNREWVCNSCCFSIHTLPGFSLAPSCRQTLPSDWSRFSASKMSLICVAMKRFHISVSNHVTTRQTENTLIWNYVYTTYWRCDDSTDIPSSLNLASMGNEKSLHV